MATPPKLLVPHSELIRLYREGFGSKYIAKQAGCSNSYVRRYLISIGVYEGAAHGNKGGGWNRGGTSWNKGLNRPTSPTQLSLNEYKAEREFKWPDWSAHPAIREYQQQKASERMRLRARQQWHDNKHNKQFVSRKRASLKKWKAVNIERVRQRNRIYTRTKKETDPSFKIAATCRRRIKEALDGNFVKKTERSMELIGCSWVELKAHLEKQFNSRMLWANYGTAWHIDHIVPCASFDLTMPEERKRCFHYTNLRPLWAKANLRKNAQVQHTECLIGMF
jgi:hypothetical protein